MLLSLLTLIIYYYYSQNTIIATIAIQKSSINYYYQQQGNTLIPYSVANTTIQQPSNFGSSISLNAVGTILVIGDNRDDNSIGGTFIYRYNKNTNWTLEQKLVGSGYKQSSQQGYSVAIASSKSGADIVLIGGPGDDFNTGAAWFFMRKNNKQPFTQFGNKLLGNGELTKSHSEFGSGVGLNADGNYAAIAGYRFSTVGTTEIWLFHKIGNIYQQMQSKLIGFALQIPAGTVGIKLTFDAQAKWFVTGLNSSHIRVYKRHGGIWHAKQDIRGLYGMISKDGKVLVVNEELWQSSEGDPTFPLRQIITYKLTSSSSSSHLSQQWVQHGPAFMTDNHDVNWLLAISSNGLQIVAQLSSHVGSGDGKFPWIGVIDNSNTNQGKIIKVIANSNVFEQLSHGNCRSDITMTQYSILSVTMDDKGNTIGFGSVTNALAFCKAFVGVMGRRNK
jgi:hypothetical protein